MRKGGIPNADLFGTRQHLIHKVDVTAVSACRLLVHDTSDAWCDWAKFCFRQSDVDKGEECLRQALSREPENLQGLVTLACVCWYKFCSVDPMYIDDAIAVCDPSFCPDCHAKQEVS